MNRKRLKEFKQLLGTISPSGYEEEAARTWAGIARTFTDDVSADQHGNVYACINRGGSPRVMLAGHIDEIGLMVTYIDENGFLNFKTIGGWDPQVLPGQQVVINTADGRVVGVIGKKPVHLLKKAEREKVADVDSLWIDIGARNREDAARRVAIGDPAVLNTGVLELDNGLLASRGMDDKAGAYAVLDAARRLSAMEIAAEVFAVATVQEEVGLRGSTTSAYKLDPQVGIAVDVCFGTDYPSMDKKAGEVNLGAGPQLSRGPNINPSLYRLLLETAGKHEIPHQLAGNPRGTGTDANTIQLTRKGVPTALVSIPSRYMHSPCEVVGKQDVDTTAEWIAQTVAAIDCNTAFNIEL